MACEWIGFGSFGRWDCNSMPTDPALMVQIADEIVTWAVLAVAVFLAIAAIPLAKRLLDAVLGGGSSGWSD